RGIAGLRAGICAEGGAQCAVVALEGGRHGDGVANAAFLRERSGQAEGLESRAGSRSGLGGRAVVATGFEPCGRGATRGEADGGSATRDGARRVAAGEGQGGPAARRAPVCPSILLGEFCPGGRSELRIESKEP